MLKQFAVAGLKLGLMFAGGYLIQRGIVTDLFWQEATGIIVTSVSAAWSATDNVAFKKVPRVIASQPIVKDAIDTATALRATRDIDPPY